MSVQRNPKDSMVSTWRKDRSQWTWRHKLISAIDVWHGDGSAFPVFKKTDPVRHLSQWSTHRWILYHALWPVALQALYVHIFGHNLHPVAVVLFYSIVFKLNGIHEVHALRRIGKVVGFLDGDKPRDDVPDVGVKKVLDSVELTTSVRSIFTVFLAYKSSEGVSFSAWLPVELFFYSIVLDFWFYVYHRSCHEIDGLWQYHRTHHLTKHPNPLLSAYSDSEQEILEIAVIPLLTYGCLKLMGFPMGFYDWWIMHQYLLFAEAFGHTGLRIHSPVPGISGFILGYLNMDLIVEDHDLHHRKGWKKSANYGKQTRLWDRLFGSCGERIESVKDNIDYVNQVHMPLY